MQDIETGKVLKERIQLHHFHFHLVVVQDQSGQSSVADQLTVRCAQTLHLVRYVAELFRQQPHAGNKIEVYVVDRIDEGHKVEVTVQHINRLKKQVANDGHIIRNEEHLKIEKEAGEGEKIGDREKEQAVKSLFGKKKVPVLLPGHAEHPAITFDRQLVHYPHPLVKQPVIIPRVVVLEDQVNCDQPGGKNWTLSNENQKTR